MSEPFLAEIRIVGFNFAPRGWAFCDGQILPISQNQSLYSLLGTTYGGDGRTSFALPDLRGRTSIHVGASNGTDHRQGQKSGEEGHQLSPGEMPSHTHPLVANNTAVNQSSPTGNLPGQVPSTVDNIYSSGSDTLDTQFNPAAVALAGQGHLHNNMMPYLALNFCIALRGLFPSRN